MVPHRTLNSSLHFCSDNTRTKPTPAYYDHKSTVAFPAQTVNIRSHWHTLAIPCVQEFPCGAIYIHTEYREAIHTGGISRVKDYIKTQQTVLHHKTPTPTVDWDFFYG